MFRFHVIQAEYGDALVLEYGTPAAPHFILIDGGPPQTYDRHLRTVLASIRGRVPALDLAVLSHVDNDHIIGLLDFFAELQSQPADLPRPNGLWHNAFSDTLDPDNVIAPRLMALMTANRAMAMPAAAQAVTGVGEGRSLRTRALALGVPINQDVPSGLITADSMNQPLRFENLTLRVVGPTRTNLEALRAEWIEWLERHEDELEGDDVTVLANSDRSVPNLSSIMLLAEADGRTLLLTGDGRSDHLLKGLELAGLLTGNGSLHVDVLKLPHHGSERNLTRRFFKQVTADIYVASANGRDGNPDLATMIWIVEAAQAAGRSIQLVVTNRTPSVDQLREEYPAREYGYSLTVQAPASHAHVIELAP